MANALIIDIDEYKTDVRGYDPNAATQVQTSSAKLANKQFDRVIKKGLYRRVILMSGGSASGKTEFVRSHLFSERAIIFDSTLSTFDGADIKIRKCFKRGIEVDIYFVFPDDLYRAFVAFKNRERVIPDEVFIKTHIGSRKTLIQLVNNYPELKITIFKSYYKKDVLKYNLISLDTRSRMVKYIESIQLSKKELDILLEIYERNRSKGNSSKTEKAKQ